MIEIKEGQYIKVVPSHWLRANSYGTVKEVYENGRFLVVFKVKGSGFESGTQLVLDEKDFNIID